MDVTNQDARTWLDAISFHGEDLHVTKRWTLVGPDRIDYQATFDDPSMFTRPWTVAYHFNRDKTEGYEFWEQASPLPGMPRDRRSRSIPDVD